MTDEELMKRLRHRGTYNEVFDNAVWDSTDDRIEQLTAERDRAYASGYSDAETEINKSALGQDNTFLHSQYANAILRIEALTAERDKYESAWMTAEGKLSDVEAESDRLREALLCGRRLWAIAQEDRVQLLIQLEQCEGRNE